MTEITAEISQAARQALRSVPELAEVLRDAEAHRRRLARYGPLRWLALALPFVGIVAGEPFGDRAEWLGLGSGVVVAWACWAWYVAGADDLADTLHRRVLGPALRSLGFRVLTGVPRDVKARQELVLVEVFAAPWVDLDRPVVGSIGGHRVFVAHARARLWVGHGLYRTVFSGPVATTATSDPGRRLLVVGTPGTFGALEDFKRRLVGLRRVGLSDPTFERLYAVYGDTDEAARLLRPALRQTLVRLAEHRWRRPAVAIQDGWVHVLLPQRRFLEPHGWDRISEGRLASDLEDFLRAAVLGALAAGASPYEVAEQLVGRAAKPLAQVRRSPAASKAPPAPGSAGGSAGPAPSGGHPDARSRT